MYSDVNIMSEIHLILHIILYAICLLIAFIFDLLVIFINKPNDEASGKEFNTMIKIIVSLIIFVPLEIIFWVWRYYFL